METVDDGSRDRTYNVAKKEGVIVLRHMINLGKGAALKTGCDYVTQSGGKRIVTLDADIQHNPNRIPSFLDALDKSDVVFGYRIASKNMPQILKFGNWFISRTTKILFGLDLKDTQCGYRAFTTEAYKKIRWKVSDYSMESEMITNVGKFKLKYKEVPIETIYSDKYKGTTVIDGMKIIFKIIYWRFV